MLVLAGAGTGKTHTLIECCLSRLLAPVNPVSLDEVLLVTFTEAAAGEMRRRIQQRLEEALRQKPGDIRLLEQLALADNARISTLHSFCLDLVRDHFHELGLDPQVSVLAEAPALLLARQTLDGVLEHHYAGQEPENVEVQQLALDYGGYRDTAVRDLVLRIHNYAQTLPAPETWYATQQALLEHDDPTHWREWLNWCLAEWRREWLERLSLLTADNPNAAQCDAALRAAPDSPDPSQATVMLKQIMAANDAWPSRRKTVLRKPLEDLFKEAQFLVSLTENAGGVDPIIADWRCARAPVRSLLLLAGGFGTAFADAKRQLAAVDFHDLEQFALRLLWDFDRNEPTAVAQFWRARLRFVFVDEYQDINAVQDRIVRALGREGPEANRCLVGDLKQSIYRFRLADPRICRAYAESWRAEPTAGRVIPLNDNFRSQAPLIEFTNSVCGALMRPELGGVRYDEEARLRFHHPAAGACSESGTTTTPRVELLLRLKGPSEHATEPTSRESAASHAEPSRAELEAFMVARRLRELRREGCPVWDGKCRSFRPAEWRDMVILLRAPSDKAEAFAKVFDRLGIPLATERGGLYEAIEVSDLLNILRLLDNPIQDIPLLAVLRSPLVGMTLDELALIRGEQRSGDFWAALKRFHSVRGARTDSGTEKSPNETSLVATTLRSAWGRADRFLRSYARWRRQARRGSLSHCLESVLEETHYEDWLEAHHRGGQPAANVRRLLSLASEFDQAQGQGLFRFLRMVEAQLGLESDPEPAVVAGENAVRLMSVHKSKGLEFPVVVIADLGKAFNLRDLHANIVLDEDYGVCPRIRAAGSRSFFPSLPYWLAVRHQTREILGEELRLLYVALTRACDRLILCGTASRRSAKERWTRQPTPMPSGDFHKARCWLDWIGPLLPELTDDQHWLDRKTGTGGLLQWHIFGGDDIGCDSLMEPQTAVGANYQPQASPLVAGANEVTPEQVAKLSARIEQLADWEYPHKPATVEPAKTSISILRRRVVEEIETEAAHLFRFNAEGTLRRVTDGHTSLSAADRGTAHHRFLQFAQLHNLADVEGARAEADRLRSSGLLTGAEVEALDLNAVARFWRSPLGARILANAEEVRRELEFTARFSPSDLRNVGVPIAPALANDEYILAQGVVDLAVLCREAIWIVDFKTDRVDAMTVGDRVAGYRPQLALYALALERIHRRPATELWLHFLALDRSVRLEKRW